MKHSASYAIEIDQGMTLETIREALRYHTPYPWHISKIHHPEKTVLANRINSVIIYFETGAGCIYLEDYKSKKSQLVDLLPGLTSDEAAQLINIKLKRMGA